jgi:diguanylate cyclase (GGDEF)-like protein
VALSRASVHTAVLFIDLDGFKMINDAHGHLAGDAVLRVIGQRLLHALREGDRVGRLGGDEFAVLLRDCPSDQAAIGFARRLLVALSAPTVVLGQTVQPTASIGIAMGTEGASADSMIRDADLAMYRAKALGKNRSEIFSASLYRDALRALVIRRDMADALAAGQLELVFQPILSLVSGRIQGFEALVRWFHPELGLVAPLEFIGLAEGSGTILPIGRWVLHEACTSAAGWQMPGSAPIGVSVNLSPIQLASADVLTDVRAALDSSGLDPRLLTLEMAEATIEDPEFVSERLSALREWGVKISIDDFGTGFSALSRVGGLPIQELKVDRSLIDQGDDKMAAAVIQLGKALGLRLIAEGVETREQLDRMRALGCDGAQGFLLGHPVAQSAVASVVLANRANPLAARGPVAMPIPALSG